ncbi:nucleosomal histone kinase 1 [Cryptotermes secundus]|uniref:nucleosomal histone kinase 1 n=1 Tax=Cryptotermes secundus TaxID=105785 RepID=UPI001454BE6F|nr:nucleosomal histone kinase 1 [Cryptotermes secundus]
MINDWKKGRNLKHVGLSHYIGSGSHVYRGQKYRFLVLERYGLDLDKLLTQNGRFPVKTVCYLGIQILDALEYIHSRGYVHADIKAPNLLLGYHKGTENYVYLLDFGIASRYLDQNGVHKEYVYDQRKAHAGTLNYVSRDAHIGAFSRRGDLETLGYNMIQWLCGVLPWGDKEDPEYIHSQKNSFMSNIALLMRQCFTNSQPPTVLSQFLKYVASLNFETKPSYAYCRNLLKQGVEDSGYVDDGMLVFGDSPLTRIIENSNQGNKCRATEDPENGQYSPVVLIKRPSSDVIQKLTVSLVEVSELTKHRQQTVGTSCSNRIGHKRKATENPEKTAELEHMKVVCNTLQQLYASNRRIKKSSVLQTYKSFTWEKIILGNPKKQEKKHATLNCNLPSISLDKYEPVVPKQRLSNDVIQRFTASLPELSELTKPRQQTVDTSSFTNFIGRKRRAMDNPENTAALKRKKIDNSTLQQPCATNRIQNSPSLVFKLFKWFNGKNIVSGNSKKQVKKHATLNCNLPSTIQTKYEPVVLIEHLPNEMIQEFTASLPEVSERTKHWHQTADTSVFSNPTPAMLKILLKRRQKETTPTH